VALLLADVLSSMKASLGSDRPQSLLLLGRPGTQQQCLLCGLASSGSCLLSCVLRCFFA
jgi:hypothetical protein